MKTTVGRSFLTLALSLALRSPVAAQTSVSELASQVIANEIRLDQRIESYTFEFESRVRFYSRPAERSALKRSL